MWVNKFGWGWMGGWVGGGVGVGVGFEGGRGGVVRWVGVGWGGNRSGVGIGVGWVRIGVGCVGGFESWWRGVRMGGCCGVRGLGFNWGGGGLVWGWGGWQSWMGVGGLGLGCGCVRCTVKCLIDFLKLDGNFDTCILTQTMEVSATTQPMTVR